MNRRLVNVLSAVGMFVSAAASGTPEAAASAAIMPPQCGFVRLPEPVGELTARYIHCVNSFILIKFHWSGGNTWTTCVSPFYQVPFYRDGGQEVVNAYYVSTPPNLIGPPDNRMCSISQPRV